MQSPLRVGILADTVALPGGIGRYVREVLAACARRPDVRLTVATPAEHRALAEQLAGPALERLIIPPRADQISYGLWVRHRAGRDFGRRGVEVVIGCKHLVPRHGPPRVLVVHDVLTITRARENALAKRILLPRQYRRSLHDAERLVAVSAATRDRLATLDVRWAAKCDVVPNGMSLRLATVMPVAPTPAPSRPFALAVGDLSPRKNLGLLTRLWRGEPPVGLDLVVVGPDRGGDRAAREDLRSLERTGRVHWVRGADDAVLRWCYEHAAVVLLPSREEGFGLPLLEARTFHAPVVAGTDAALREVAAGDPGVVHVDPDDVAGWRAAVGTAADTDRSAVPPAVPAGAWTWDRHTERLLAVARATATSGA